MSEEILKQILVELHGLKAGQQSLEAGQRISLSRYETLEADMKEFRTEVRAEFQVLKAGQQGLRAELTDRFKELKADLNAHDHCIEILNRRQLRMEADIEMLKNR